MDVNPEVERLFSRWLDRTVQLHHEAIDKLRIGESGDLDRSVRKHFRKLGEGYMEGGLIFDEHGRFVDMGSGRGFSHGQSHSRDKFDMNAPRRGSGRKKKLWYSRVWYSRLNALEGAVGFKLMEMTLDEVKEEMKG